MTDTQRLPKPENLDRVETGVVKFGDDWPGVFIRGDNALTFAHMLRTAVPLIPANEWLLLAQLAVLAETLQACSVGDTGWPPVPHGGTHVTWDAKGDRVVTPLAEDDHVSIRDNWLKRFEERKRELIRGGMLKREADAQAASEIIAELRGT